MIGTTWQKKLWASLGFVSATALLITGSVFFVGKVSAASNTGGTYTRISNTTIAYKPASGPTVFYNYSGGPFFDGPPNTNNVDTTGKYNVSPIADTNKDDYLTPSWTRYWSEINPTTKVTGAEQQEAAPVSSNNAGTFVIFQNAQGNLEPVTTDSDGTKLSYTSVFLKSNKTLTINIKGINYPNTTYFIQDKKTGGTCPAFFLKVGNAVYYSQPVPNTDVDSSGNPRAATATADLAYQAAARDASVGYGTSITTCSADVSVAGAGSNNGQDDAIASLSTAIGGRTDSLNHLNDDYSGFNNESIDNGNSGVGNLAAMSLGGTNGWSTIVGGPDAGAARTFLANVLAKGTDAEKTAALNGNTPSSNQQTADECDIFGDSALRWLLCPLFKVAVSFTDLLQSFIKDLLAFDPTLFNTNTNAGAKSGLYQAWQVFRGISLTMLVIAGIVMVMSQVLGFNFLDAYTIKKILPRLLIAIIGISLSWAIMQFVVLFFNDLGAGVGDIIKNSFGKAAADYGQSNHVWQFIVAGPGLVAGGAAAVAGGIAAVSSAPIWGPVALSLLFVIGLGILIGVAVLGIRIAVICACIIIAPLAIASYILPGTKKLWDFWKDTFITSLLMYPIVTGFLSLGVGLAYVLSQTNQTVFLSVIVYFAPYFLLPFAFKLAGGLMKTIFSIADDKTKGVFDRQKKFRSDRKSAIRQRQVEGKQEGFGVGKFNTANFRRRASVARHGESAFGDAYTAARMDTSEKVANETLQKAGSIARNDEVISRMASGMSEHTFVHERTDELKKDFVKAKQLDYESKTGAMAAVGSAELAKMEHEAEKEAGGQARVEAHRAAIAFGEWGSSAAKNASTKAKNASASAYKAGNSLPAAQAHQGLQMDLDEIIGDLSNQVVDGQMSSGDALGQMKAYASKRADFNKISAGTLMNMLNLGVERKRQGGRSAPTVTAAEAQSTAVDIASHWTAADTASTDGRAVRNIAPLIADFVENQGNTFGKGSLQYKRAVATADGFNQQFAQADQEKRDYMANYLMARNVTGKAGDVSRTIERDINAPESTVTVTTIDPVTKLLTTTQRGKGDAGFRVVDDPEYREAMPTYATAQQSNIAQQQQLQQQQAQQPGQQQQGAPAAFQPPPSVVPQNKPPGQ